MNLFKNIFLLALILMLVLLLYCIATIKIPPRAQVTRQIRRIKDRLSGPVGMPIS